jgi:hypothetical protein
LGTRDQHANHQNTEAQKPLYGTRYGNEILVHVINSLGNKVLPRAQIYRVIKEESATFWEMIVCVILSKKVHMYIGGILLG